jgi:hypothetical protein
MSTFRALALGLTLFFCAASLAAQAPGVAGRLAPSDTIYEVRLQDGSLLYARVVAAEPQRVELVTTAGVRLQVDRGQIRSASAVRGTVRPDGMVWPEDPNSTRLFFGPTGRALRAGDGYVGAFELFLPFVAVGVTDWMTIAAGTPIIPEVIGRVVYLAPRVQVVRTERVQLSTGVLAFVDLTEEGGDDPNTFGILYGAGTFGTRDHALSVGAGWGFFGSDVGNRPAFMLGGEARLNRRVKLITENYLVSFRTQRYDDRTRTIEDAVDHLGLIGAGIRIFGERLAGDLGLGLGVAEDEGDFTGGFACCIPLVNFVYNFGSGR